MGLVQNDEHTDFATDKEGNRLYICDGPSCQVSRVPWSSNWQWYGSLRDMDEDPLSLITFCSEECKAEGEKLMNPQPLTARNI